MTDKAKKRQETLKEGWKPEAARENVHVMEYHYEKRTAEYKQGEILHNFNGSDYRVMEKYMDNRLLLMQQNSGMFLVAFDVCSYMRYPKGGTATPANTEYGIEWGHGMYLSSIPSEIDFSALRMEYGKVTCKE